MKAKIVASLRGLLPPPTRVLVWLLRQRGLVAVDRNSLNFCHALLDRAAQSPAIQGPFKGVGQGRQTLHRRALAKEIQAAQRQIEQGVQRGLKGGA